MSRSGEGIAPDPFERSPLPKTEGTSFFFLIGSLPRGSGESEHPLDKAGRARYHSIARVTLVDSSEPPLPSGAPSQAALDRLDPRLAQSGSFFFLTKRSFRAIMISGRPIRFSQSDGSGNSREIPPGPKGKRRLRVRGRFSFFSPRNRRFRGPLGGRFFSIVRIRTNLQARRRTKKKKRYGNSFRARIASYGLARGLFEPLPRLS